MRKAIPVILLVLLVGLTVYAFFSLMEPYTENMDVGWSKAAKRNPYLAIEQFGRAMGFSVSSSNNFASLKSLPDQGTVFISDTGEVLTRRNVDSLISWMRSGGHLIVAAHRYSKDSPDLLLEKFGVRNIKPKTDRKADKKEIKLSDALEQARQRQLAGKPISKDDAKQIPEQDISLLSFKGVKPRLRIHFLPYTVLDHPFLHSKPKDKPKSTYNPSYWAGDSHGVHFMQFDVGDGMLSVMSDKTIWQSDRAGELDHAFLFWMLDNPGADTVLLYGATMPSIFVLLWKYASEVVVVSLMCLLAWLRYRSKRLGPVRDTTVSARRSMSEHIRASAEYLWRHGEAMQLLTFARQDLYRMMLQRIPAVDSMNDNDRNQVLSERSGLMVNAVAAIMDKNDVANESEFITLISGIQKIKKTI